MIILCLQACCRLTPQWPHKIKTMTPAIMSIHIFPQQENIITHVPNNNQKQFTARNPSTINTNGNSTHMQMVSPSTQNTQLNRAKTNVSTSRKRWNLPLAAVTSQSGKPHIWLQMVDGMNSQPESSVGGGAVLFFRSCFIIKALTGEPPYDLLYSQQQQVLASDQCGSTSEK